MFVAHVVFSNTSVIGKRCRVYILIVFLFFFKLVASEDDILEVQTKNGDFEVSPYVLCSLKA